MLPGRPPNLQPESQFPGDAIQSSVQKFPVVAEGTPGGFTFTWNIASAADQVAQWGTNVVLRDRQLRDFWPTETYLAGAVASVSFRNATLDWEIKGPDAVAQASTEMLQSAIAGDAFGWVPFIEKFSQDLFTQDNGAFIELIRDPGTDANTRFKDENAPVIGIAHLDSGQCMRTGDPTTPVIYTDRLGALHEMKWYQVVPFSDYPSAIERMHGVGYCAVSRALRVAQIMRSIFIYKDEKISGRHFKQIHFVSGVSRQDIKDEITRGQEDANNSGQLRFILPAILASLDPEKPVSTATIDLASLPDGFDLDQEMKWYISGLAIAFGVDYQEFAPLPGGNIGSSGQSMILHRKTSGKNPAVFMRTLVDGLRNYGAFPRNVSMSFNDKDEQEELERQEVRTKAMEEAAITARSGILPPDKIRESLVRRGIFTEADIEGVAKEYGLDILIKGGTGAGGANPIGQTGGNTIVQDAGRQDTGATNPNVGDNLRKDGENAGQ
jgi:hypothetical protein